MLYYSTFMRDNYDSNITCSSSEALVKLFLPFFTLSTQINYLLSIYTRDSPRILYFHDHSYSVLIQKLVPHFFAHINLTHLDFHYSIHHYWCVYHESHLEGVLKTNRLRFDHQPYFSRSLTCIHLRAHYLFQVFLLVTWLFLLTWYLRESKFLRIYSAIFLFRLLLSLF